MNIKEFFVYLVAIIAVACIVLAPVGCQVNRDRIRTEAIAKSADPIATSCALDSTDSGGQSKAICTIKASGK